MDDHECRVVADKLYAFLDDALDVPETLNIQAHLETCPACYQRYQFVLNLRGLLREEAETFVAPQQLEDRIRALGRAEIRRTKRWRFWLWPGPVMAATALLTLVLLSLFLYVSRQGGAVASLVAYHRTLIEENIPLRLRTSDPQRVTTWIREQMRFPVDIPQASLEGYTLVGATTIPLSNESGTYVLYKRQAERLAYLVFPEGGISIPAGKEVLLGSHKLSLYRKGGYMVGIWRADGHMFALIGEDDEEEFLEYAAVCLRFSAKAKK
jgi:mycothiol system anti-sigma-R factor